MLDIGWTELLLIGVVALIVVGPKDLPGMFRTLGRFTGKMKGMAREFQRAMNDAADESGVKDIASDLKNVTSAKSMGLDTLNKAASSFEKWEPGKSGSDKGSETAKLSKERAAAAKKINEATAKRATERLAGEAVEASKAKAPTPKPAKKPAAPRAKAAPKPKAAKPATKVATKRAIKPTAIKPTTKPKPRVKAKPKPTAKPTEGDA